MRLVKVIAWFEVIFGINTTSKLSKLLHVISRAVWRVKFETILKYHKWYLCQISRTNHALICLYNYLQTVCNFHMYVFQIKLKYHGSKPIKLQNFSCSSVVAVKENDNKINWKKHHILFRGLHMNTMRKIIRGPCVYKPEKWDSAPLFVSITFNLIACCNGLTMRGFNTNSVEA